MTARFTVAALVAATFLAGCGSTQKSAAEEFHTSGSRDADQRAEQRVAAVQQARGDTGSGTAKDATTLYARLGGDKGVRAIVDGFVDRALVDPRVNWTRKDAARGGPLGIGGKPTPWSPTSENVAALKDHLVQFVAVATGGPPKYDGRGMKQVHGGMNVTNAEFDAAIGDLKAALDALEVPVAEQKELVALFESVRPQVAESR